MHLVDHLDLPDRYSARPYRGRVDHPAMNAVLAAYRELIGDPEVPTVEQQDVTYSHLEGCDLATDVALVEIDDAVVAYARAHRSDLESGVRDCIVFAPTHPDHLGEPLFRALVDGQERHMVPWTADVDRARFRAYAVHPGPGEPAVDEAAWLEDLGYVATEWGASLVRPHFDDIPIRTLPDGVEVRPVTDDQVRQIWDAHIEAFRGEWDFFEPTEEQFREFVEEPERDISLWKVAWVGDQVVGQVKSFVNAEENALRGYRRGYTENISVHHEWRNRGIAGALLAMSLHELRSRGFTEAALGVDTNNPGGAFQLYTGLGFELQKYEAVYTRPIAGAAPGAR